MIIEKTKAVVGSIPGLCKILINNLKVVIYLRNSLSKKMILSKKAALSLAVKALENTFEKDLEEYEDAENFGPLVMRVRALHWIRCFGEESERINQFCDDEINEIDKDLDKGNLMYQINAVDYEITKYLIGEYRAYLKDLFEVNMDRVYH